jgi:hypothetical protein
VCQKSDSRLESDPKYNVICDSRTKYSPLLPTTLYSIYLGSFSLPHSKPTQTNLQLCLGRSHTKVPFFNGLTKVSEPVIPSPSSVSTLTYNISDSNITRTFIPPVSRGELLYACSRVRRFPLPLQIGYITFFTLHDTITAYSLSTSLRYLFTLH